MIQEFTTSLSHIPKTAKQIAKLLEGGEVIALIGPLGSGKTTFTKYLAKLLKISKTITSPTYTLLQHYTGKLLNHKPINLYHLDLYRTNGFTEVALLGIEEFWQEPGSITVIEWADTIQKNLPQKTIYVYFS